MVDRVRGLGLAGAAGLCVAAALLFFFIGTLTAVAWRAENWAGLSPRDGSVLRFTILQAALSALLSVGFAIPLARALARRRFFGRGLLILLLGAPFILPVIVAILGLLAVFGRGGIVNSALEQIGVAPVSIFGLGGILLAHVFFNLPLATRLILQGWLDIPAERFRLAATLGFGPRAMFAHLEWPMLRAVLPGAAMVIFLICLTSFAVALTLGGGPGATTIELAIYQAFRFDFDLSKAALLASMQFALCGIAALVSLRVSVPSGLGAGLDRVVTRWDGSRVIDALWIAAAALFLLLPLLLLVSEGLARITALPDAVYAAAARSLGVALSSALLTLLLTLPLAVCATRLQSRAIEAVGYLGVAASPLVLGTGLFLLVYRWADPVALALPVTIAVNAVMSLPFALRILTPALREAEAQFGRLADTLALAGWARWRIVILPRLRAPLGFAAGLAAALSMGDLGVITLFADPQNQTLPLEMYRLMNAYRLQEAQAAALLLLVLSLGLFWLFARIGRRS